MSSRRVPTGNATRVPTLGRTPPATPLTAERNQASARSPPATSSPAQRTSASGRSAAGTASTDQRAPVSATSARSGPATNGTTGTTQTLPPPSIRQPEAPSQAPSTSETPQTQSSPPPTAPPALSSPPIPPPPIFTDLVNELIVITDIATYDKLLSDVGRKHLLVEFFAPWCGACMLINRKLEELATTYNGKLIIAKVNVDDCEQIAVDNDVSMMPSFMLMKENQVLEKFSGSNEEKLMSTIKKYVGEPTNGNEETNGPKAE